MKHKLILKSLAELPANALNLAASAPGHAMQATRNLLAPPVRATRRQIREARRRSGQFIAAIKARSLAPLDNIQPWPRGGLNE